MNLILDIGNTNTKVAVFEKNVMLKKITTSSDLITKSILKLQKKYLLKNCIVSSVTKIDSSVIKKI